MDIKILVHSFLILLFFLVVHSNGEAENYLSSSFLNPIPENFSEIKKIKEMSLGNNDSIQVKTFKTENGWGYDIYIKGKLYVHQPMIPGMEGFAGFISEDKAKRTANFVADKIAHNILPPTITLEELERLKVLK